MGGGGRAGGSTSIPSYCNLCLFLLQNAKTKMVYLPQLDICGLNQSCSFARSMVNAIEFEIGRQIESLSNGIIVANETRSFDPALKMTLPMRDKEAKQDYRFDLSYFNLF